MKATATQVYKRISNTPNKTEGILNYDEDNAYPQRIKDIVNNSGVASACVGMKTRFLMGGGFTDKEFYKQKVNRKGVTVDKLLRKVCTNLSLLPFVGFQINYNGLFQKTEINYVPFDHIRLPDWENPNKDHPGMISLYDDWQRIKRNSIDRKKIDYINFYNPDPIVIQEEVDKAGGWGKYKGQVFLYSPNGLEEYPLAAFDSVLEDMQTDSKTKSFKFRNITTNFMASHILITDKIEGDETVREEFIEGLEQFQGADDSLRILHLEKTSESSTIDLKKIDIQNVERLYEYTEKSIRDNIILNFLIPQILLIPTPGKLGASAEINDATAYYNGITYHERLIIEEIFTELFKNFATPINVSGDFTIIPFKAPVSTPALTAEYFPYVTKNQILNSLGLPEMDTPAADVKPMYEALGVGGLQALTALLADSTLTKLQKQNALVIIFKLNLNDAILLSGGGVTAV